MIAFTPVLTNPSDIIIQSVYGSPEKAINVAKDFLIPALAILENADTALIEAACAQNTITPESLRRVIATARARLNCSDVVVQ